MFVTIFLSVGVGAISSILAVGACITCISSRSCSIKSEPDEQTSLIDGTVSQDESYSDPQKNLDTLVRDASTSEPIEQSGNNVPDSSLCSSGPQSPGNPSRKGSDVFISQDMSPQVSSSSTLITPETSHIIKPPSEVLHKEEIEKTTPVKEVPLKDSKKEKKSSSKMKKLKGKDSRKRFV